MNFSICAFASYSLTRVPTLSPLTALAMLAGWPRSNTRMGRPLSRQRVAAVESMTARRSSSTRVKVSVS